MIVLVMVVVLMWVSAVGRLKERKCAYEWRLLLVEPTRFFNDTIIFVIYIVVRSSVTARGSSSLLKIVAKWAICVQTVLLMMLYRLMLMITNATMDAWAALVRRLHRLFLVSCDTVIITSSWISVTVDITIAVLLDQSYVMYECHWLLMMVTAAMVVRLDMSIGSIVLTTHFAAPLRRRLQREWFLVMLLLLMLLHIVLLVVDMLCYWSVLYAWQRWRSL